jgi:RNA recognition motif-containing protein
MGSRRPVGMPYVLRLRGLPYHATSDEVIDFMYGVELSRECVHIIYGRDGRPSGEAYLELKTEVDMKKAMGKHKEHLGSRYVEIFRSNPSELADVLWHGRVNGSHPSPSSSPLSGGIPLSKSIGSPAESRTSDTPSSTATTPSMRSPLPHQPSPMAPLSSENIALQSHIRLRGLPFTAVESDILQFFAHANIYPVAVLMVPSRSGRPTGECFVELSTDDDVKKALTLHKEIMGNRYIEIFRPQRSDITALVHAQAQYEDLHKRLASDPSPFSLGEPSDAPKSSPRTASPNGNMAVTNSAIGNNGQNFHKSPMLSSSVSARSSASSVVVGGDTRNNIQRSTPELTGR